MVERVLAGVCRVTDSGTLNAMACHGFFDHSRGFHFLDKGT